ncbi:conserved hypothetical protein [Candidatus Nitrospira nitrosa]|uniref:Uncharacterized protein n=1 Tax=Candidatus Nitrospira nitrosa TaxID=1742972 RepID=A0A0S4L9R0_9BACT|nr:conserved hypothetical protein [Candidatus Nitrospira nitrosa]
MRVIPDVPGTHSKRHTLDELHGNLKEVRMLCLEEYPDNLDELPRFVGLQQIDVAV